MPPERIKDDSDAPVVLAPTEVEDEVDAVESPRGWMEGKRALMASDRCEIDWVNGGYSRGV